MPSTEITCGAEASTLSVWQEDAGPCRAWTVHVAGLLVRRLFSREVPGPHSHRRRWSLLFPLSSAGLDSDP